MNYTRSLTRAIVGVGCVLILGTAGYTLIEGWSLLDGFYMTVITVTTIGFREVHELSTPGMVFTLVLIFVGLGVAMYSVLTVATLLIEGEVEAILTRRRSMKAIERMSDHYVVCGFGRMGSFICRELHARGVPLVVVENGPDHQDKVMQEGFYLSPGDATEEHVLVQAGIKEARGLVAVLDTDAANVYAVLTARELNPQLEIIARASGESAQKKLLRAGANRVISPYKIGGMRMVMGILKPAVMNFLEVAMDYSQLNIDLEEVLVSDRSVYQGARLVETGIRKEMDLIIIAVKKKDGQMVFNPGPSTIIEGGDTLIAMGERTSLVLLEQKARGTA